MEEKTEKNNLEEQNPQEIGESAEDFGFPDPFPLPNKEIAYNYSDSLCNHIRIGEIELQSPYASIDSLIELARKLLKDKAVKDYLDVVKFKDKLKHNSMYG